MLVKGAIEVTLYFILSYCWFIMPNVHSVTSYSEVLYAHRIAATQRLSLIFESHCLPVYTSNNTMPEIPQYFSRTYFDTGL